MQEQKRERRIRDKLRMKAKCAKLYPRDTKRRDADNLAVCSCWMCGNPRKFFAEETMQERRMRHLSVIAEIDAELL